MGASPDRVTVPVEVTPPASEAGDKLRVAKIPGVTVNVAVTDAEPTLAVILAVVEVATPIVVILNEAEFSPAATVTLGGGKAQAFPDARLTTQPPAGAGPFNTSDPVAFAPPMTDGGEIVSDVKAGGVTVNVALTEVPRTEMVAAVVTATGTVVIVKVAELAPAATVTDADVAAQPLLEASCTVRPPVGAAPLSVTVPVEEVPPTTEVGDTVRLVGVGGMTVRAAVAVELPETAVIVAEVVAASGIVATTNVAEVAPSATVTLLGGIAYPLLDVKVTTAPPIGAGAASVTVPVDDIPPITLAGETVTLCTAGAL